MAAEIYLECHIYRENGLNFNYGKISSGPTFIK